MTPEEMNKLSHIPTEAIERDIEVTKQEIENLRKRLETFEPIQDRLQYYMTEGKIKSRESFVKKLETILKHRKQENERKE